MREIKFRAWDGTVMETWEFPHDFTTPNFGEIIDGQDPINKIKWMQYTGLKDKSGVEIYEGDVVGYTTNYYGKLRTDNKQTIKWEDDMEHDGFGCPLATGFLLRGYDWEVIGNIYKNPELLDNNPTND